MSNRDPIQARIDEFYMRHGPCCAGCDWWRFHNSVSGECTKTVPVAGSERAGMLGMTRVSANVESGHIMTKRDHHCGEFIDSYDWNS